MTSEVASMPLHGNNGNNGVMRSSGLIMQQQQQQQQLKDQLTNRLPHVTTVNISDSDAIISSMYRLSSEILHHKWLHRQRYR